MSFTTLFHSFDIPQRAGLARQLLLAGATLLLAGSTFAQTPAKSEKAPRILTVADSVQLVGSKISGGWREHAADGSWRRVGFVLDRESGSITFGDGESGRRVPGAVRYSYAGAGKGGKETHTEARAFAGASPALLARADQSSPIPKDVATRIRELGGDFRLLQRLMDENHRLKELGSAFDAARRPSDDGGVFGGRPGGSPGEGKWSDPQRGVGRGGQASDDTIESTVERTDREGNHEKTTVTRHGDGSTTTEVRWTGTSGATVNSSTDKDVKGNVTGGYTEVNQSYGERTAMRYTRNVSTGEVHYHEVTTRTDGTRIHRIGSSARRITPPETGSSSRGFDEAWLYESAPWLMDALYTNWKHENDLLVSGGRIAQPGRGESPPQAPGETNRVGTNAVVNCGDSNTNPCAGAQGAGADTRGRLSELTQPPRDVPTGGPLGGTGGPLGGGSGPFPPPSPQLKP